MVLVWIALVLGLAGVALGVTALLANHDTFSRCTIHLAGGEPDRRVSLVAQGIPENHPNGNVIEVRNSKVTGDSTGEYVRTCTPVLDDEIECNGAFQLSGGTIEIEATAHDDPGEATSAAAISGETGAYAGAFGLSR
jgi:hypothetical protein